MSNRALNYVWQHSRATGNARLMLVAMADKADARGVCWPGVETLAAMVGVEERSARRLIRKLEQAGEITVEIGGGVDTVHGRTNRYTVVMSAAEGGTVVSPVASDGGTAVSPDAAQNGGTQESPGDSTVPRGGTAVSPDGGTLLSPKPPAKPPEEPKSKTALPTRAPTRESPLPPEGEAEARKAFEQAFPGGLNGATADRLRLALAQYGFDWVRLALEETRKSQGKTWKYTQAILDRWFREGGPDVAMQSPNGQAKPVAPAPQTSDRLALAGLIAEELRGLPDEPLPEYLPDEPDEAERRKAWRLAGRMGVARLRAQARLSQEARSA